MLYLSYTACKRYEKCGELQRQHRAKLVDGEIDQTKFLLGRAVHLAFEWWARNGGQGALLDYFPHAWVKEEAEAAAHLPWTATVRAEAWEKGLAVCATLDATAREIDLLHLNLQIEQKLRAKLTHLVGMFALIDVLAYHPTEPVAYVGEMKSGSSFDKAQVAWYGAVLARKRQFDGLPPLRLFALSLRPATDKPVKVWEIGLSEMQAQIVRATETAVAMERNEWPITPSTYCSICEGQTLCPDYQSKFGHLMKGRVGLG